MSEAEINIESGQHKEYFICDRCGGTGLNPAMSTIHPTNHPDCPDCHGRRWVPKSNYRSPHDPNQDELWEEFWRNCVESDRGQEYFNYEEAKKRYRITRVK